MEFRSIGSQTNLTGDKHPSDNIKAFQETHPIAFE